MQHVDYTHLERRPLSRHWLSCRVWQLADGLLPKNLGLRRRVLRVVETLDLDYYAVRLPVCAAAMGSRGPQSSLAAWAALEEAALCRDANGEQRCSEQPLVPRYRSTLPMIA